MACQLPLPGRVPTTPRHGVAPDRPGRVLTVRARAVVGKRSGTSCAAFPRQW
ncbi:hypothetical protein [Micromonospora tarensis]|uniref:Uncharacterized protein n=1 Tax=Micromonospora tarensis TaxID=2806100 RepID=A0ABS1YB64_9ACTN|nr:hypothetical protein [Micromonospora tarensis]MBM0274643.1 hypothetical protein [Micromonospora tarensis]